MFKRFSKTVLLIIIAFIVLSVPVIAATYSTKYTVSESNGNDYDMLPVFTSLDTDWLVNNGYIESDGLDTRIETLGGTGKPWLVVDDQLMTAIPISENSQTNLYFTTGNADASSMDIITGCGGYITVSDDVDLELGDDFEIEVDGYINTNSAMTDYGNDLLEWSDFSDINLLTNASFEIDDDTDNIPDDWDYILADSRERSSEEAKYGTYSLKLTRSDTNTYATQSITDYESYKGKTVKMVGWVKCDSPTARLSIEDGVDDTIVYCAGTGDWELVTVEHAVNAIATKLNGTLGLTSTGTAYFDGAVLLAEDSEPIKSIVSKDSAINLGVSNIEDETIDVIAKKSYADVYTEGYSSGTGTVTISDDYIYLYAKETGSPAERTIVTDTIIDLTDVDTISVDWENTGDGTIYNDSYIVISSNKTADYSVSDVNSFKTRSFTRQTTDVDVSGLSGNYYVRVHARSQSNNDLSEINVYGIYVDGVLYPFANYSMQATGITNGEYNLKLSSDGTTVGLYIDEVLEDSASTFEISNNSYDWVIAQNNSAPYLNYYKHTVSDTLIAWYQPNDIISGTELVDRQGGDEDGVITWGSNPSGIDITLGSMEADSGIDTSGSEESAPYEYASEVEVSDWYGDHTVSTTLQANPFRPFVQIMSDSTTMSELQAWRLLGLALVLLVTVGSIMAVRGHLAVAGIAAGVSVGVMVAFTIFPLWCLVFVIGAIALGLIAERSPYL